jgi:hypothetical protein
VWYRGEVQAIRRPECLDNIVEITEDRLRLIIAALPHDKSKSVKGIGQLCALTLRLLSNGQRDIKHSAISDGPELVAVKDSAWMRPLLSSVVNLQVDIPTTISSNAQEAARRFEHCRTLIKSMT